MLLNKQSDYKREKDQIVKWWNENQASEYTTFYNFDLGTM